MTITSKYNSRCKKCNGHITIGQQIEWDKEHGPRHITCPKDKAPQPGPYAGKFRLVKELYDTAEAAVGAADLDREYTRIAMPAGATPKKPAPAPQQGPRKYIRATSTISMVCATRTL